MDDYKSYLYGVGIGHLENCEQEDDADDKTYDISQPTKIEGTTESNNSEVNLEKNVDKTVEKKIKKVKKQLKNIEKKLDEILGIVEVTHVSSKKRKRRE